MTGTATTSLAAAGVLAFAAVFSWPAIAADQKEPEALQPSSRWNVDYSATSCKLARIFGEGDDKVALIMEQHAPTGNLVTTVVGAPVKKMRLPTSSEEIGYRFGPYEPEGEATAFSGTLGEYKPAAFFTIRALGKKPSDTIDAEGETFVQPAPIDVFESEFSAEHAARVEWLEIRRSRGAVRLATGPMDKALAVMDNCMENLVAEWGIDILAHRSLSRTVAVANDAGSWISSIDYPGSALRAGAQGVVRFRLVIDEEGKPISCAIDGATDPDEFSELTCDKIMSRAKFEPALDAEGEPIRSYFAGSVRFQMGF